MKLYKTRQGIVGEHQDNYYLMDGDWDSLINREGLYDHLLNQSASAAKIPAPQAEKMLETGLLAPIGNQEIWAAGVTWLRSRDARMEEAKESGGATFYDKVYVAERPELFFKGLPHR